MRISDWSSDVCSSDLAHDHLTGVASAVNQNPAFLWRAPELSVDAAGETNAAEQAHQQQRVQDVDRPWVRGCRVRPGARRVGKECASTWRHRGAAYHSTKQKRHSNMYQNMIEQK